MNIKNFSKTLLLSTAIGLILSACGKSGSDNRNPLADNRVHRYEKATTLSGSVSSEAEPLQTGKVNALSESGVTLASAEIHNGRFMIQIPAGTQLPVVLKAYLDSAQNSTTTLEAVAVDPSLKKYDINPLSTAIAAKARALGGYSRETMTEAAMSSVAVPDANKTTGGFRGDPTKQYGGWH